MEIKYKKVSALYAILVLICIFALKTFVFRPASQLIEIHNLKNEVNQAERNVREYTTDCRIEIIDDKNGVQNLLLSVLECISEAGCPVISGAPSRQKSPDYCPMFNLDIVFGGDFPKMIKAMCAIDSLVSSCRFETTVSSCHIGAERTSNGSGWNLVCRETLQCFPVVISISNSVSAPISTIQSKNPFYMPSANIGMTAQPSINTGNSKHITKNAPQIRLVGHIGSGTDVVVILEIGGENFLLHKRDGILLKDYGDSVKVAWNADTLIVRQI